MFPSSCREVHSSYMDQELVKRGRWELETGFLNFHLTLEIEFSKGFDFSNICIAQFDVWTESYMEKFIKEVCIEFVTSDARF